MPLHARIFTRSVNFFDLSIFKVEGADATPTGGYRYKPCDIAVVYGLRSPERRGAQSVLRTDVHVKHAGPLVVVESSMIGRTFTARSPSLWDRIRGRPRRPRQSHPYLRLAVGGALGDDSDFNNTNSPPDRWERLQADLGIAVQPYRTSGDHVLLIGQVENDASLRGVKMVEWIPEAVTAIRAHTDRRIVLRLHPGMRWRHHNEVLKRVEGIPNLEISPPNRGIAEDLDNAWCCVTFSSGAAIDALLAGIPAVALSPASLAYKICSTDFADVGNPALPERQQWLQDLSYGQWTLDELGDGTAWRHIEPAVKRRMAELAG